MTTPESSDSKEPINFTSLTAIEELNSLAVEPWEGEGTPMPVAVLVQILRENTPPNEQKEAARRLNKLLAEVRDMHAPTRASIAGLVGQMEAGPLPLPRPNRDRFREAAEAEDGMSVSAGARKSHENADLFRKAAEAEDGMNISAGARVAHEASLDAKQE